LQSGKKKQKEEWAKKIRRSLEKCLPTSNKVDTIKINEKNTLENNFKIDETLKNDDIEECLNFGEGKVDATNNFSLENHRSEDKIPISTKINKLTDDRLNENNLHLLKDHAN